MKPYKTDRTDKMRVLRSQTGFTITELMVVIALSGILMAAAATGFSAFFAKFNDMSKTMELQRDAFNCMQTIKSGIPIGSGAGMKFQGIATADSVIFLGNSGNTSNNIKLFPPKSDIYHQADFIQIYYDGRFVRATYLDASLQPASPLYLFPKRTRTNDTTVTKLKFTKANSDEVAKVIKVELEARVELRKNVYKTVSYSTLMALTMK
jgi:prepilin-type N-terminal cleavage/methylation domain-containing protein